MGLLDFKSRRAGSGGSGSTTYYYSFDELRAIPNAQPGLNQFFILQNALYSLTYFVSTDLVSPDEAPNTIITANGNRIKICGSEW